MKTKLLRRLGAILMVLVMTAAFMPQLGGYVAYAGASIDAEIISGLNTDNTANVGSKLQVSMDAIKVVYGETDIKTLYEEGKVEIGWYIYVSEFGDGDPVFKEGKYDSASEVFTYTVEKDDADKWIRFSISEKEDVSITNMSTAAYHINKLPYIDIDTDGEGNYTVTGNTYRSDLKFTRLLIDGSQHYTFNDSTISHSFSAAGYSLAYGWHKLSAELSDGTELFCDKLFPVYVTDVPDMKAGFFNTYTKKLEFTAPNHNGTIFDYFIQLKKSNQDWSEAKLYGPMSPNSTGIITGLSANTKYNARAVYVVAEKSSSPDSTTDVSKFSKVVSIKTGPKAKPAIKSVKISKAKVKKVKVKGKWYLDNGEWKYLKGYTAYETTYKVTITFKKKPGVAGIEVYAGGVTLPKYLKGNKKVYTTTFTVGGKAIGKKTAFKIRTKGNNLYGAWSPYITKKKIKIKK